MHPVISHFWHMRSFLVVQIMLIVGTSSLYAHSDTLTWAWDVVPALPDYSEWDSTVYIDPAYDGSNGPPAGTIDRPCTSWSEITLSSHVSYVQKRGTSASIRVTGEELRHVLIGAYGTGPRPVLLVEGGQRPLNLSGSLITIRDLEIVSGSGNPYRLLCLFGDSITVYNNLIHGVDTTLRPTFAINAGGNAVRIVNNVIHTVRSEAVFGGAHCDFFEIGHNVIYDIALAALDNPDGNGADAFQFCCGAYGLWFHHNTIDARLINRKFLIITGCESWCGENVCRNSSVIENNTITMGNGRPVVHIAGHPAIIRNNFLTQAAGQTGESSGMAIWTIGGSFEVYNNIFKNYSHIVRFGNSRIYNNIIYNTNAQYVITIAESYADIRNNIFAALTEDCVPWGHYPPAHSSRNVFNIALSPAGKMGGDYITGAPLFLNPENDDFRLENNSPALGAGDPSFVNELTPLSIDNGVWRDIAGNQIPSTGVNCGPYQAMTAVHSELPRDKHAEKDRFAETARVSQAGILTLDCAFPQVLTVSIVDLKGKTTTLCPARFFSSGVHTFDLSRVIGQAKGVRIVHVRNSSGQVYTIRLIRTGNLCSPGGTSHSFAKN